MYVLSIEPKAGPSGRAVFRRASAAARLLGLRVQPRRRHGCLSVVSVVCRQVEVCASG
jgi:hypothetical protein